MNGPDRRLCNCVPEREPAWLELEVNVIATLFNLRLRNERKKEKTSACWALKAKILALAFQNTPGSSIRPSILAHCQEANATNQSILFLGGHNKSLWTISSTSLLSVTSWLHCIVIHITPVCVRQEKPSVVWPPCISLGDCLSQIPWSRCTCLSAEVTVSVQDGRTMAGNSSDLSGLQLSVWVRRSLLFNKCRCVKEDRWVSWRVTGPGEVGVEKT